MSEKEVIQPRQGEEVDSGKLAAWLKGRLEGSDQGDLRVSQFSGGHANLTYLLQYPEHEYVLRRPPHGPLPPLAHDMAREYRVLTGLNKGFDLAPRAYLFCDDLDVLGAPFFVMERRRGTVVRKKIPEKYGGGRDAKVNRILSEVLIKALAKLHRVDYEAVGLGDLGKAQNFMKRQTRGWAQAYHRSKVDTIPGAEEVIDWLKSEVPAQYNGSIIHNDWRLDNIMLDDNDPSKVVAAFDWDMCTIGEPLADVGTLFSLWIEKDEDFGDASLGELMPSKVPGFMTRAEATELYGRETGFDVSNIRYYQVFGLFKMAIVAQQIYKRFKEGQTSDERFRDFDRAAVLLIAKARALT